jgi:hypothetical protein
MPHFTTLIFGTGNVEANRELDRLRALDCWVSGEVQPTSNRPHVHVGVSAQVELPAHGYFVDATLTYHELELRAQVFPNGQIMSVLVPVGATVCGYGS